MIIFGGGGQDGTYLRNRLSEQGYHVDVYGFSGAENPSVDVGDFSTVSLIIKEKKPKVIFHLAASSTTRHEALLDNQNAIADGAVAVLEAVDRFAPDCKVFLASSGLIFLNEGKPICETSPLALDSAYALARAEALMCARYFRKRGRSVYVGFLFNHESPLRPSRSVVRQVSADVVKFSQGKIRKIRLGSGSVIKEWTYAEDVIDAMLLLIDQSNVFEVNIGSGKGYSVKDFAIQCCRAVGVDSDDCFEEEEGFVPEYPSLISDPSQIYKLGWKPRVNFEQLAEIMVKAELS